MPPSPPAAPALAAWLGTWSRPVDRPAQIALGLAAGLLVVVLAPGGPEWLASLIRFATLVDATRRRRFLVIAGFAAAFLSLAYIAFYLRGGPRAPDAAVYWLQGRALSHGELRWSVPEPSASFRARDLLFATPDHVAGIFAPGFALLLAPGFLVRAPMLIGPLVAAGLVAATWLVTRELAFAAGEPAMRADLVGRVAAGLCVLSATLRYHTADTLPYGATAMGVALALGCAMQARRTRDPRLFGVAGLALGMVAATHPMSAVPVGAVVVALGSGGEGRRRALAWGVVALLPGVLLLLAAHHAAVGRTLASPMALYASAFEPHAPFALRAALVTAAHWLRAHLLDVANLEPLALLALVPLVRRIRGAPLLAVVIAGQMLVAGPLDATTVSTGAGARLLVPVIPLEHALMALALVTLFPRALGRATLAAFALALAGFAVHASHDHQRLSVGDLGRPHYEPDVAREAGVTTGLLFFDDDQGFELAFDPTALERHEVVAARLRGDDHDRLLYDSLVVRPSRHYVASATTAAANAWTPPGGGDTWRFEAESDWPPVPALGGRIEISESSSSCVSNGRVLTLTPSTVPGDATVTLELPVPRGPTAPERKLWTVIPRVLQQGTQGAATLELVEAPGGAPLAQWTWTDLAKTPTCVDLPAQQVELGGDRLRAWLVLRTQGGAATLDKTTLRAR